MALTFKEVDQLLRIIEEFPADEVRFEYGDLKLHVRRDGARAPAVAVPGAPPAATLTAPAAAKLAPALAPTIASSSSATAQAHTIPVSRDGLVPVLSPMMGVFYGAPAPDSPTFVIVGQDVTEATDLCIIEVMKVMNNIKAPCAGRIVEIAAENNKMVDRGAPIFWIEPTESKG